MLNKMLEEGVNQGIFKVRNTKFAALVLVTFLKGLESSLLINFYQDKISNHLNKRKIPIPKDYNEKLLNYSWPGNIRELQNFVELIISQQSKVAFNN